MPSLHGINSTPGAASRHDMACAATSTPVQNDASQKMLLLREKMKVIFFPDGGGRTGPLERASVQQSRNKIVRIDCGSVSKGEEMDAREG